MFNFVLRAAAAGVLLLSTPLPAQPSSLRVEPYAFRLADGTDLAAERGTLLGTRGPQRSRARGGSRSASSASARPTRSPGAPIVYLAGGPGGSGVATARGPRQPIFLALAPGRRRDRARPARHRPVQPYPALHGRAAARSGAGAERGDAERLLSRDARRCVARWRAAGVAVNGYTTEQSADDIEDLRRALGVRQARPVGASPTARISAMATMRRHPRLDRPRRSSPRSTGIEPDGQAARPYRSPSSRGSTRRCRPISSPRCAGSMPASTPSRRASPSPARRAACTFRADSFPLRMMAGHRAQESGRHRRSLPAPMPRSTPGQTQPLAPLVYGFFYRDPLTMSGMPELMDIASGISDARLALVRAQAPGSLHRHGDQLPDAAAARRRAGPRSRRSLPAGDPLEHPGAAVQRRSRRPHPARGAGGGDGGPRPTSTGSSSATAATICSRRIPTFPG